MEPFKEIEQGVWTAGKPTAPPLVMLHGWGGTGPTNFSFTIENLAKKWHLVAIDLVGHGHGTRLRRNDVSVEDLAQDVREKVDSLKIQSAVVAGYSLGGAVAQMMWRDHCDFVDGLILAGTATRLSPTPLANLALHSWATTGQLSGPVWGAVGLGVRTVLRLGANRGIEVTNLSGVAQHDGAAVQFLAKGLVGFNSSEWIESVNVPVGVLVCLNDRLVPTRRQIRLAERTNAIKTIYVPGGHLGFLRNPTIFAAAFEQLASSVKKAQKA